MTTGNPTLPSRLVIISLTLTCILCLGPIFLSDEVASSATMDIEADPAYSFHAASDTTDLNLWLTHFRYSKKSSNQAEKLDTASMNWIAHSMTPDSSISWTGQQSETDTIRFYIQFNKVTTGTQVELTCTRKCGYFSRLWKWILAWQESGLQEKNLSQLQQLILQRANQNVYYGFVISETGFSPTSFAGYRSVVHQKDVFRYFSLQIQNLYSQCQQQGIAASGRACLLRYASHIDTDSTEVFVGLPIPDYIQLGGTQRVQLPAGTYAATIAEGGEAQIQMASLAIRKYLADRDLSIKMPVVEEYIHESVDNADPALWKTKIYVAYK